VDLEVSEAHKRRRDPTRDGARLELGVSVVEHVALDAVSRQNQREGAGRGDAEVVHRLRADELAQRRAEDRAPVGSARVRRGACSFELHFPALSAAVFDLAEGDRAAVAELARPVSKLMAAVAGCVGFHAGNHAVSCEHVGQLVGGLRV